MGEYASEKGRQMVYALRSLFDGLEGFKVYETGYDGPKTAMITTKEGKEIRFDMLMKQEISGGIHYLCESKFRADSSQKSGVKSEFKDFLRKACETLPYVLGKYGENHFCFLFISSIPFDIWEEDVREHDKLIGMIDDEECKTNIHILARHIRLMILPNWMIAIQQEVSGH